jgi:hypothetical protein
MAILQSAFNATAGGGLRTVPVDKDERAKYETKLRAAFERERAETHKFFLEEKLFIPKAIADCAESTLREVQKEGTSRDLFYGQYDPQIRRNYTTKVEEFLSKFNEGMSALEILMREHIEGRRLK